MTVAEIVEQLHAEAADVHEQITALQERHKRLLVAVIALEELDSPTAEPARVDCPCGALSLHPAGVAVHRRSETHLAWEAANGSSDHPPAKPFRCAEPGCGRWFRTEGILRNHHRQAHIEQPARIDEAARRLAAKAPGPPPCNTRRARAVRRPPRPASRPAARRRRIPERHRTEAVPVPRMHRTLRHPPGVGRPHRPAPRCGANPSMRMRVQRHHTDRARRPPTPLHTPAPTRAATPTDAALHRRKRRGIRTEEGGSRTVSLADTAICSRCPADAIWWCPGCTRALCEHCWGPACTRCAQCDQLGDEAWKAHAACRGMDPDLFFPTVGQSAAPARAICAACPVDQQCLQYALANSEAFGVWGGLDLHERHALRRARRHRGAPA